jgi:uncharacterized protein (TIGR01777 family)
MAQLTQPNTQIKVNKQLGIILAGGSGHVGAVLRRHFAEQGHSVKVLSRQVNKENPQIIAWDGISVGPWLESLDGCDVLVNLCGRSVNCRYTAANRREIMDSRIKPTLLLGKAIAQLQNPPRLWLNASTATIYRHTFDRPMDEVDGELSGTEPDVPRSWDFSVEVGKRWEDEFFSADTPNTRRIALRSAMVMSSDRGSIFDVLLGLVRFGLGGTVGSGKQFVSWIHEADFVGAVDHLIGREHLAGVVNIASLNPVTNREFMKALRKAWGTRIGMPAPRPILEIGTFLMRTESELVLKSRRTIPRRLLEDGFQFLFTEWEVAARELVSRWKRERAPREEKKLWNAMHEARVHERAK